MVMVAIHAEEVVAVEGVDKVAEGEVTHTLPIYRERVNLIHNRLLIEGKEVYRPQVEQ
jgi:hypothetical protein